MNRSRVSLLLPIPFLAFAATVWAQEGQDLTNRDLVTLMSMDVTVMSAAKREQAFGDAPAPVYVHARGSNSGFASTLLVVDRRNINTPQFSSAIWAEQPASLEVIERVEAVRASGGSR